MKQRITYILHDAAGFSPSQIKVEKKLLGVNIGGASKEHRLTFSFSELPQEIWQILKQCNDLHIRWVSEGFHDAAGPFVSRLPPGLHVFLTPQPNKSIDQLCPLLKKVFSENLKCEAIKDSFIQQPFLEDKTIEAVPYQHYSLQPSLKNLITYVKQKICPKTSQANCASQADSLSDSSYFDIDFDVESNSLIIKAFWDHSQSTGKWQETFESHPSSESIELGVLKSQQANDPEELSLEGFLAVLGEDSKPSATQFSFPSRHHPLRTTPEQSFTTSFRHPTGLHPTLAITFPSRLTPPADHCTLHAYFTLPSFIFLDKYQFSDPLFLASHRLRGLRAIAGETDLEAPDWVTLRWGSAALLEIDAAGGGASDGGGSANWTVTVPAHLRYLPPARGAEGLARMAVPWPAVFWACEAAPEQGFAGNPFDRASVGFDALFAPETMFHQVPPGQHKGALLAGIDVPILDLDKSGLVEIGTVVSVLGGLAWIAWKLWGASTARRSGGGKSGKRE